MACEHKQIKSVNCVLYCCACGAVLPPDYLTAKETPAQEEKPAEAPKKPVKRKRGESK